jgi:hypothetical protein
MKTNTLLARLIASTPSLQDELLEQFLASPKLDRMLEDVLGHEEDGQEYDEAMEGWRA